MNKFIEFFNKVFTEIGVKKFWLSFHYGLAILTSLLVFIASFIGTFTPATYDITAIVHLWYRILIYCGVVVAYITILSIFDKMQEMNKARAKFDFIAFYIGFCMFVTLALIIVCVVFMFRHDINEQYISMWKFIIGIFGSMFGIEAFGGYIYKGYKNKLGSKNEAQVEQRTAEETETSEKVE